MPQKGQITQHEWISSGNPYQHGCVRCKMRRFILSGKIVFILSSDIETTEEPPCITRQIPEHEKGRQL